MSDKIKLNSIAAALIATFSASLTASPVVNADENPFSATAFSSGYMIAEGKCGDKKAEEGKCGDKKSNEGKCGSKGDDMKDENGKTSDEKSKEGKCGEAKCGDIKK